ncbi:MAG: HlyD family type I secretion periplasmic adaptor subunit [Alphaproteobacteria bacterium]|nr:HlyD family type I secretion periplasmic adaptor subunit [Alphaproteobacteria bacterium]
MAPLSIPKRPRIGGPLLIGLLLIGAFFGGFGAWSIKTELDSAAVAPGVLMVETNRKTVKHLEGGIVGEILVREGDAVQADQLLFRLDATQAAARLDLLSSRQVTALAREARLKAEQVGAAAIDFPPRIADASPDSAVAVTRAAEEAIFEARRRSREGQVSILNQQIAAFREEIIGLEGQIAAQGKQIELITEEIADLEQLFEKGLARKARMLLMQREQVEIEGQRAQHRAEIARIRQAIGETKIRINELTVEFVNAVVAELSEVQAELLDLEEQVRAARDVLVRTDIKSPADGVVIGLTAHTVGGVIGPGEAILEIVPQDEKLVIDARVDPVDADIVLPGLEAQISFSAFSSRDNNPSRGIVTWVSGDGILDDQTGARYYLARVEIDKEGLVGVELGDLRPGMLADVFILTGKQRPIDYLIDPLTRNLQKSLREL